MLHIDFVENFFEITVAGTYDENATQIKVNDSAGLLPNSISDYNFDVLWFNKTDYANNPIDDPFKEFVTIMGKDLSSSTIQIERAKQNTPASKKMLVGKKYVLWIVISKKLISQIKESIADVENRLHFHSNKIILDSIDAIYDATKDSKLTGIEEGANKYIHPATHSADIIIDNALKRFTTDAQQAIWTNKQDALGYTPENIANKGMSNGYATLDTNGKIPLSQIPDLARSNTFIVETIAERDALSNLVSGDRAIVLYALDGSREGYLYDGIGWIKDSDTDWENINLDWNNIINKPSSNVASIDDAVAKKHNINDPNNSHYLKSETYTKAEIENGLNGKANILHTHTKAEVTDFAHTHTKAEVTDFAHTHTKAEVTDFAHTHTKNEITDFAHTHNPSEVGLSNVTNDAQVKKSEYTAKGDILIGTGNGTYEKLPIGSNGQVLMVDSSTPTGYKTSAVSGLSVGNADTLDGHDSTYFATPADITTAINILKDNVSSDGDTLAKLRNLIANIQTLLNSDNINLDTLQEIVDYIENHQSIIDGITTSKVNVADIINDLTHTDTNKPLSANQGKILKDFLDTKQDKSTAITTTNINSQSVNYANSAGSASASDVYLWAKQPVKPTYSKSEITDFAHTHTKAEVTDFAHSHDELYLSKSNNSVYNPSSDYNPATKKYVDIELAKIQPIGSKITLFQNFV
jgi:hypothetical protein